MVRRILKAFSMVVIAVAVGVGMVYAAEETFFRATGVSDTETDNSTEIGAKRIHMTSDPDTIALAGGNDVIHMGTGDDEISMANGNDIISFFGKSNTTETIEFNDNYVNGQRVAATSYIKWTGTNDTIEVRSGSGDVVITLGQ